jgi:hypothetical protein
MSLNSILHLRPPLSDHKKSRVPFILYNSRFFIGILMPSHSLSGRVLIHGKDVCFERLPPYLEVHVNVSKKV